MRLRRPKQIVKCRTRGESASSQSEDAPSPRSKHKRDKLDPRPVLIKGKTLWQVDLGIVTRDGRPHRVRKTFADRKEAETFSQLKRIERENRGVLGISMSERLRGEAIEAARLLEPYPEHSILSVVQEFVKRQQQLHKSETVRNAFQLFLGARAHDGLRARYLEDLKFRLGKFCESFGDRVLAGIEPSEIAVWLRRLGQTAISRNTYVKRLSVFFEYDRQQGWIGVNPMVDVSMAKVAPAVPGILSVEETARLLESADEETLPFHALGLFAGLRSTEIMRLKWEHIRFEERLIEVPALSSKTASRRLVTMQPNLIEWLLPYRGRYGAICPTSLHRRLALDRKNAGISNWPSNAARHSFASYHLAHFKNAPATSLELGHVQPAIVFANYRELVRPAEAERFWKIVPVVQSEIITAVA
jgi:integrase